MKLGYSLKDYKALLFSIFILSSSQVFGQTVDLELEDPDDMKILMEDFNEDGSISSDTTQEVNTNADPLELEAEKTLSPEEQTVENDDLQSLMDDIGKVDFELPEENEKVIEDNKEAKNSKAGSKKINILSSGDINSTEAKMIFEVGKLEKDLLEMAKKMQGQIPSEEWNDIAGKSAGGTYEVVQGDWLWKISERIFGSGFYYAKIWALNPFITNPHEIEPGMILTFTTGSDSTLPSLEVQKARNKILAQTDGEFSKWGNDVKPPWLDERQRLQSEGFYLQYSTGDTKEDLDAIGEYGLTKEYEAYEPPRIDFLISIPEAEFDASGFDKNAKVIYNYKEGFHLNTFITNNVVQDFGRVEAAVDEKIFFTPLDKVYVKFDENIDIVVGDKFSIYTSQGEIVHPHSDRKGFKYVVNGHIEVIQKHEGLWECKVLEISEEFRRGDRVTIYTPKIERITQNFNPRLIESILIASTERIKEEASFGDVVFLDRGRADGVEVGNVFEVYGFRDRNTGELITPNPTYKNGEIVAITVTDNFTTGLVTQSVRDFQIGDLAVTKTKEAAAKAMLLKNKISANEATRMSNKALDNLDVELNLDDLNDSLLDKADQIQFTEDELSELERQEKEKSALLENEKDLRALERLEGELETAEKMLNEARLDEDKLLENQNLNALEKKFELEEQESLDELEENFGKRYLDEDLNDKENPYGLTEYDIEEIDELLNKDQVEESSVEQ